MRHKTQNEFYSTPPAGRSCNNCSMYSPRSTDFADNNDHELFGSDDEQEPPVAAAAAATESEKAVDETADKLLSAKSNSNEESGDDSNDDDSDPPSDVSRCAALLTLAACAHICGMPGSSLDFLAAARRGLTVTSP